MKERNWNLPCIAFRGILLWTKNVVPFAKDHCTRNASGMRWSPWICACIKLFCQWEACLTSIGSNWKETLGWRSDHDPQICSIDVSFEIWYCSYMTQSATLSHGMPAFVSNQCLHNHQPLLDFAFGIVYRFDLKEQTKEGSCIHCRGNSRFPGLHLLSISPLHPTSME